MPLSVNKLEIFLNSKNLIPSKYYILDKTVFFIEVLTLQTASTFFLYVPSKYRIPMRPGKNSYDIRYIDMDSTNDTAEDYAEPTDKKYNMVNINLSPDRDGKLEEHLENNYKKPISLQDVSSEDRKDLKSIYRQAKRLKYCTENIKYKLAILYKNYICTVRRDDSIDCFSIEGTMRKPYKRLMVVADLELLYSKGEKIAVDIITVTKGLHDVLQNNHTFHTNILTKMLETKEEISSSVQNLKSKERKYDKNLEKLLKMLNTMEAVEKNTVKQIFELREKTGQSYHKDAQNAHQKSKLENKLNDISNLKEEILKTISQLQRKRDNTALSVDKIMFDNNIMLDCMVKNFSHLKNF